MHEQAVDAFRRRQQQRQADADAESDEVMVAWSQDPTVPLDLVMGAVRERRTTAKARRLEDAARRVAMPRRGSGRPGWTCQLFDERWAEAVRMAGTERIEDVAVFFVGLNGNAQGIEPPTLRRLHRRRRAGDMPD